MNIAAVNGITSGRINVGLFVRPHAQSNAQSNPQSTALPCKAGHAANVT